MGGGRRGEMRESGSPILDILRSDKGMRKRAAQRSRRFVRRHMIVPVTHEVLMKPTLFPLCPTRCCKHTRVLFEDVVVFIEFTQLSMSNRPWTVRGLNVTSCRVEAMLTARPLAFCLTLVITTLLPLAVLLAV